MRHRTSRRELLGNAALAGAGAWVAGRYALSENASPNETVHLASIGTGGRGRGDLEETARVPGVAVVALCDVDEKFLNEAGAKFPKAKKYTDYRKMFDEMHKDIDAVTVGTPDHHHAPASMLALKHKKHVYCEKPLTHSIYEARMLAETAARTKVATQMGNQGHAGQGVRRVVELVRAGVVGPIREVVAWTNRPVWPQGLDRPPETPVPAGLHWDVWLGPAPQRPHHDHLHPFAWRGWWDFGTGALGDMACHILDGAFWACDLRNPATIETEGEPVKPECGPNWEIIRMEFPARGDLPPCKFSWYDGKKTVEGKEFANQPPAELFEGLPIASGGTLLIGDKGKIYIPDDYCSWYVLCQDGKVHLPDGKQANEWRKKVAPEKLMDFQPPAPSIPAAPGHDPHPEWIDAIRNGKTGGSHFGYGGAMTEMILTGVIAFRVGRKIEWDAANMKVKNCPEADPFIKRTYRKGWTL